MVVFGLIYRGNGEIRYEYFPEGDKNSTAGIIGMDIGSSSFEVIQPAEREIITTNEGVAHEERPREEIHYVYADHAIRKLAEVYENGVILQEGTAMWY